MMAKLIICHSFLLSLFCFQLKFACWLLLGPWILAQYWKWKYAWPSVSNGSSSSKFLISIMCKTKVPSPVLGANKKLKMREKKKEGKKKLFKLPHHRKKEIIFHQCIEINILSTLLWFIPNSSCFKLWLHSVNYMTIYRLFLRHQ